MKSKMKSAFAIIAVALMVMVAVVPMVSVFTGDSDAAVANQYDPKDIPEAKRITVNINVYNVGGTEVTENVVVRVTYGESEQYYKDATYSGGKWTAQLYDTKATSAKVKVLTTGYKPMAEYTDVTIGTLNSGDVKNIVVQAGVTTSPAITLNTKATVSGTTLTVANLFPDADTVTVKYQLYSDSEYTKEVGSVSTVKLGTDSKFSVTYSGTSALYMKITGITVKDTSTSTAREFNITSEVGAITGSSAITATIQQQLVRVVYSAPAPIVVLSDTIKGSYPGTTDPVEVELKRISPTNKLTSGSSYWYLGTTTQVTKLATATLTWNDSSVIKQVFTNEDLADAPSGSSQFKQFEVTASKIKDAFFGRFTMSAYDSGVYAIDGQGLTITAATKDSEGKYTDASTSLSTYVHDGFFISKSSTEIAEGGTWLKIVATGYDVASVYQGSSKAMNATYKSYTDDKISAGNCDIVTDGTDYTKVTVTLRDYGTETAVSEVLTTVISGVKGAFGATVSSSSTVNISTVSGSYTIFIKKDSQLTFAAASGQYFSINANEDGPYFITGDTKAIPMHVAQMKLSFKLSDGDGAIYNSGNTTDGVITTLTIRWDKYSILGAALGTKSTAGTANAVWNSTNKTYDVEVAKGYYNLAGAKFWTTASTITYVSSTGTTYTYTFSNSEKAQLSYAETSGSMAISALDTTYNIYLKDSTGNIVIPTIDGTTKKATTPAFAWYAYDAYKTEGGTIVYGGTTTEATVTNIGDVDAYGKYSLKVPSTYVNVTIPSSQTTAKVVVLTPVAANTGNYYLNTYYPFVTDSKDSLVMTVTANTDQLSATVTKYDEKTPIEGVKVTLKTAGNVIVGEAVTDDKGAFALNSTLKIVSGMKLTFSKNGYSFDADQSPMDDTKKKTTFSSTADLYYVYVEDADKMPVTFTTGTSADVFAIAGATVGTLTAEYAPVTMAVVAGDEITPTLDTNGSAAVKRTFSAYSITADDIKNGYMTIPTNESTCYINVQDSEGTAIAGAAYAPTVSFMNNGSVITPAYAHVALTVSATLIPGTYKALLTAPQGTDYYAAFGTDGTDYVFTGEFTFTNGVANVKSLYTKIFFGVQDADESRIAISTIGSAAYTVASYEYPDLAARTVYLAAPLNQLYFYGVEDATYYATANWTINTDYHIYQYSYIDEGMITAAEKSLTFTVTDAAGTPVTEYEALYATITPFSTAGTAMTAVCTTTLISATGAIPVVIDDTGIGYYGIQLYEYNLLTTTYNEVFYFTFDFTETTDFVANETIVVPTFVSANGFDLNSDVETDTMVVPLDDTGLPAGTPALYDDTSVGTLLYPMIVDFSTVSYYTVVGGVAGFTFEDSILPIFVANESIITGSVPYSNKDNVAQTMDVLLCNDGNVVDGFTLTEVASDRGYVEDYKYSMILDLSDYSNATAGVAFDAITVNYFENGVAIASGSIDPLSTVNNIYTPEQQAIAKFEVTNKTIGVAAGHTVAYVTNNLLVLSADNIFFVADEGTYTDGQYKYTFAGWYVDGIKVSANADYAMNIDKNVVAAAQYDVVYEKVSDVNDVEVPEVKEQGIDTNVLIIGICAVIVALIAVVYAVIKKE